VAGAHRAHGRLRERRAIVSAATSTLGDLVLDQPAAAALFERLGLDYCCGGGRTLEDACAERSLDAGTVAVLLDALAGETGGPGPAAHDVAGLGIAELCDHIVTGHHDPLRGDLPPITDLLSTVARVHGADHPEVIELQRVFARLREDLETHMALEEESLFPACRALDGADAPPFDRLLLVLLKDDHDATGAALTAMRELTGGHDTEAALCATHRRLLASLVAFERDMHQHVHEENNVLFPRVLEAVDGA
jgi:regulator of cell morphogenesis and NO signaling